MAISFVKYHGTGNDFIIIDDRNGAFVDDDAQSIALLCDRHKGIGADGLMLLRESAEYDFKMIYYNSDGALGSMCGNGARCIVQWAKSLGVIDEKTQFEAPDGLHQAWFDQGEVVLAMSDVSVIDSNEYGVFLDTGSPHQICVKNTLKDLDVLTLGRSLRHDFFGVDGANINFVSAGLNGSFDLRTYERGVEAETLSCGTGATAAALAMHYLSLTAHNDVSLNTLGGRLKVAFTFIEGQYTDITLTGPAVAVFKGEWL
ncbi:MAG: diaminopimelate epimerase [Flavobacteriaceae bacterium]|nr:diaminopimelate epimerase [Flavobacteriaceae bacterium]